MPENQLLSSPLAGTMNLAPVDKADYLSHDAADTTACEPADNHTRCLVLPQVAARAAVPQSPGVLQPQPVPQQSRPRMSHAGDPWVGRTIRDYVIEEFLGAGAMGRVYRARHRWLEMNVAFKILKDELYDDESCIARFRREAVAAARLNHQHIVRAFDGGMDANTLFLVTEFVQGVSLSTLLQIEGELSVPDVCEIICQAAEALQHAHERGMVHRDIKPSNMMLSAEGQVKVLDLGLARFAQGHATLTETGHVMGTLDFMAPEQAGDSRHVDIRADIYSLGCTLYCLLTGVPPFSGPAFETPVSKMLAHSDSEPPAVSLRRKKVPAGVLECLRRMMEKDRDRRPSCPAEVVRALKPFTAGANLAALGSQRPGDYPAYVPPANAPAIMSTIDWLADVIFDGAWVVFRTLLCMVGVLERQQQPVSHLTNSPRKTTYQVSPKGLASAIVLLVLAAFLYASGFRIYFF